MSDRIKVTIENHVADVRLIRTDKMNALDNAMFEALVETGDKLKADKSIRAVVISGEGRAFCAGLDMGNFQAMSAQGKDDGKSSGGSPERQPLEVRTHGIANRPQYAAWVWREVPVPVIAAVHGVALGGGFQVMMGADIRITHPETKLSILESRWGLIPDMAGTPLMRAVARDDVIRELTYTGRMFSGIEAKEMGFATKVSETPLEDAHALAAEIATKNPASTRGAKKMFNELYGTSDADALLNESILQDQIIGKPNQIEAVMSQLEGRPANYEDVA